MVDWHNEAAGFVGDAPQTMGDGLDIGHVVLVSAAHDIRPGIQNHKPCSEVKDRAPQRLDIRSLSHVQPGEGNIPKGDSRASVVAAQHVTQSPRQSPVAGFLVNEKNRATMNGKAHPGRFRLCHRYAPIDREIRFAGAAFADQDTQAGDCTNLINQPIYRWLGIERFGCQVDSKAVFEIASMPVP
jgi:hypothetical protein